MKYIIFFPILLVYVLILCLIVFIQCLWSFDFKKFDLRKRNLNHKIGLGYWLCDRMDIR
jgi:hypothetical protein